MPSRIKFIFSIIVILASIAGYYFQAGLGKVGPSYAALAFGVIAVVAMWIFPEVSHKKDQAKPSQQ
jgi:Na+/melibiose symporter-like transporter